MIHLRKYKDIEFDEVRYFLTSRTFHNKGYQIRLFVKDTVDRKLIAFYLKKAKSKLKSFMESLNEY